MSLMKWSFIGLLALPLAEIAVFLLVTAIIGWLWTSALFLATSAAGMAVLSRSGRSDLDRLRRALAADGIFALHLETPGIARLLGGILLLMPGFMTDLLGAGLLFAPIRRWTAAAIAMAARRARKSGHAADVIDLEPSEWKRIPDRRTRSGRRSNRAR